MTFDRFPGRQLAVAALAVLVCGCSFIPSYQQPAAPIAASWPTNAPTEPAAEPAADIPWQSFYNDPRLNALIEIALFHNRDLRVAALNIEQARAQYQIQRAAQLPSLALGATASRTPSPVNGRLSNAFSVGGVLSAWEIDFFGRIQSLKEVALAQYFASEYGARAARISLIAGVASTWFAVLADQDLLDITRQTLQTRQDSQRLAQLRFDNGVSSELDLRQAESLTEAANATLAALQRQRALDENALALLVGRPVDLRLTDVALSGGPMSDTMVRTDIPAGLPSDLLLYRPDILQAEQQLIAANANIGAARAAFFPAITLTAQFGTASNQLSGLFKSGTWAFTPSASALLPIFNAGRNQAALEAARAGRGIALAQYEKAIQTAFREVADALAGRPTLSEQLRATDAQARAEAVRFRLAEMRYQNGISSYLELLDAQRTLFAARQAVVQIRLAQLQNRVQLYKALGGGWGPGLPQEADARATPEPAPAAIPAGLRRNCRPEEAKGRCL